MKNCDNSSGIRNLLCEEKILQWLIVEEVVRGEDMNMAERQPRKRRVVFGEGVRLIRAPVGETWTRGGAGL